MVHARDKIRSLARMIYGPGIGEAAYRRISVLLDRYPQPSPGGQSRFSEADAVLITYGDSLLKPGSPPLQVLHDFAVQHLTGCFSAIHFLPFFPFSSDDGFSVIDFFKINPRMGSWKDVERFARNFDLMFDYVLNHISAQSPWFKKYLATAPGYADLAIEVPLQADISTVTRPRALPLLTPFTKDSGERVHVWTTFSDDQVDLNYESLDVLVKMVEVLLYYVEKGARMIRMDAVAYLWKEMGTSCIHLAQTHAMVQLFRSILDYVAPQVIIITETNVPHLENISYFGDGYNEAQMVYNFTLPPLLLHTFDTGDAAALSQWARTLDTGSDNTTFFNFTASHDGIGVRPLEGILRQEQIARLIQFVLKKGGQVSYKQNSDGSESPYELNITYVDAMEANAAKFLASQSIALVLPGVPAVYIHSLLGSRNWHAGVEQTGRARTINRKQLDLPKLLKTLEDNSSLRSNIFYPYCDLLKVRRKQPAFHPNAGFEIIHLDHRIFGIRRSSERQTVYALTNVGESEVPLSLAKVGATPPMRDLLSHRIFTTDALKLEPYQILWLEAVN